MNLFTLIKQEGWDIKEHKVRGSKGTLQTQHCIVTPYDDILEKPLKIKHPALTHLELTRYLEDPALKYQHLRRANDILWPNTIWHHWTERRFMTFVEPWNYITLAAGASTGKSHDVAKYVILFWYAAPKERNATVASVTLASLMGRVWGYLLAHIKSMAVPLPYKYSRSAPPKILYEESVSGKNKVDEDPLHGIFAVTARVGDDDQAIATWIGKHPKDKILIVLDECTDMPMSILNATPNLDALGGNTFQLIGIGNSNSTLDLHGVLSTPKAGWKSVSTDIMQWDTTQVNGTCLYFSPYDSPAIIDPDPERRKKLEKFLIGRQGLKNKEQELGVDSDKFYRWVLGFWKSLNLEDVIVTEAFLQDKDFYSADRIEWSGFYPITRVAGLDPAFSTDGDKCIFRVAHVGHSMNNKIKIDLGSGGLTHEIKLSATTGESLERQIGNETIRLMQLYNVPLEYLAIDVTGQGKAIGEVIVLLNAIKGYPLGHGEPLKIYSMSHLSEKTRKKSPPGVLPMNAFNLWNDIKSYIANNNVAGLDDITRYQLTNRRIVKYESKQTGKLSFRLESKLEYKRRASSIGNPHSPDEADAAALIIQLVMKRLNIIPGTSWNKPSNKLDARTEERMILHTSSQGGSAGPSLSADFSSGLEAFAKFYKPF